MGKKRSKKNTEKIEAIELDVIVIGVEGDENLQNLIMCGIFDVLRPFMSESKAMISAETIAEDIVADLTSPSSDDYAAAKRAKLVTDSLSDWLSDTIAAVLGEELGEDKAPVVTEKLFMQLFERDGELKFCSANAGPDALTDMREQLDETAEPRPIEEPEAAGDMQPDINAIPGEVLSAKPADDHVIVYVVQGPPEAVARALMYI